MLSLVVSPNAAKWLWLRIVTTSLGQIMMKYRKKPVVIEAVQFDWAFYENPIPTWLTEAMDALVVERIAVTEELKSIGLKIKTLEGTMIVAPGDWIIKGIKGEIYPCKPDIFAATYEPVVT